jgi:hypothetical protein
MSGLEWTLAVVLGVLYIALLCTVALLTFRKGYVILGILGFLFPILWLIGAILPARSSSGFDVEHYQREQAIAAGNRGGAL